ncbi:MAG: hypothetical protein A2152_03455 [Candidatus Levybacteria bacterium RBG_16_35_6]|nr:MAG: hypothetical protein A2152_03455 [Candidatus Levybacteria bacterium RBG_16_35_6]
MKSYLSKLRARKGFTLIELLVVIGILGILAAALVATIDPFEQLKKADDSKIKNVVVEFQNANVRYFTTHTSFPWNDTNSTNVGCTGIGGANIDGVALSTAGLTACIGAAGTGGSLIGEGELKDSFTVNTNDLAKVFVQWETGNASSLTVCFSPTSKSQKASPETMYDVHGDALVGCPDATAADGTCYWCTK